MKKAPTTKLFKIHMRELEKIENPNDERIIIMKDLEPEKKVLFVDFEESSTEILIAPFSSEKSMFSFSLYEGVNDLINQKPK